MADEEQFSLCWNNFNSNLSAGFHESLCRGDLVDVTLAAEGQLVKAHRLVLSVCSPYFRKMFTQMPANQHAFVFLKDVSAAALKDLIQFMYCGEVNVKQDALPAFISTAEALQIKGLTESNEPGTSTTNTVNPIAIAKEMVTSTPATNIQAARIQRSRAAPARTSYKMAESEDEIDEKPVNIVQTQSAKRSAPKMVATVPKRVKITPQQNIVTLAAQSHDPLDATEPEMMTPQELKATEAEFIDLPIEPSTKVEPDTEYAEDTGEVEAADDEDQGQYEEESYADMKYDETYYEGDNDDTKAGTTGFGESYATEGEHSATEAQDVYELITKVRTPKGGVSLLLDEYRFVKYTSDFSMEVHIFRCTQYKKEKCRARVQLNDLLKTAKLFNEHNHETVQNREHRSFIQGRDVSQDIQLIMNNRGRTAIYHEQHKFTKQNENHNVSHYRCTEYKLAKCRARIAYDAETGFAHLLRSHNHFPNLENRRYHLKDMVKIEDVKKEESYLEFDEEEEMHLGVELI